jgi:hypothetical protein
MVRHLPWHSAISIHSALHSVLDTDTSWCSLASDVDFCRICHYLQPQSRSYNKRVPPDTAAFRFFLSGSRSPKQHPASFQCRQPILYLSLGNVHAATLWRYRSNSWPSCRNSPVHSGDDCRRLADSQHCQKNHSCREHLCTPSACPSLRSVILTLTIQFPSFASGKCQLSSQQRSKARMPV